MFLGHPVGSYLSPSYPQVTVPPSLGFVTQTKRVLSVHLNVVISHVLCMGTIRRGQ